MPTVSIIIPTYDRAGYLRETLGSALAQTYRDIEVVVLDDASPDDTPSVVESFADDERLRYTRHPDNLGPNGNWRAGMDAVTGDFFCFLADDDTLEPTFAERLVAPLVEHDDLVVSFCDHWVMDKDGQRLVEATDENTQFYKRDTLSEGHLDDFTRSVLIDDSVYIGAVMFRSSVVPSAFLSPKARSAMGAWILYQCTKTGLGAYYVPERLMNCRWQQKSVSRSRQWLGNISEGQLFRYRTMLHDPDLVRFRDVLQRKLADVLSIMGRFKLTSGKPREAREMLAEAVRLRSNAGDRLAYGLARLGRPGAAVARALYILRNGGGTRH